MGKIEFAVPQVREGEFYTSTLGECLYLYLDADYKKVGLKEQFKDAETDGSWGAKDGKRCVLVTSVSLSEALEH